MKLGADAGSDSEVTNSGSRGELVVSMLAQRPGLLLMLVYNRNGKWSPPRGGLKLQVRTIFPQEPLLQHGRWTTKPGRVLELQLERPVLVQLFSLFST